MNSAVTFNSLLVPTDFSDNAWVAFEYACALVDGDESEIMVVHAIDPTLVDQLVEIGAGDHDAVYGSVKKNALARLERYAELSSETVNVDTLVCEGEPFFEITRKAEEFAVDAIVMSKMGTRNRPESLLFGSTAEKVLRGCRKPVIVLPVTES